jgi:hypothetical protein
MSCMAMGMAATQPVRLNNANVGRMRRAFMGRSPVRGEASGPVGYSPGLSRLLKASRPTDFRKDRRRIEICAGKISGWLMAA